MLKVGSINRLWASILVAISAAAAVIYWRSPENTDNKSELSFEVSKPADRGDVLGLEVQHNGPDLNVTWNPPPVALAVAEAGTLTIVDNGLTKAVHLDSARLRRGHVLYTPMSDDILIRLDVKTSDHRSLAESVEVLRASGLGRSEIRTYPAIATQVQNKQPGAPKLATSRDSGRESTSAKSPGGVPSSVPPPPRSPKVELVPPRPVQRAEIELTPSRPIQQVEIDSAPPPLSQITPRQTTEMATQVPEPTVPALSSRTAAPDRELPASGNPVAPQPLRKVLPSVPLAKSIVNRPLDIRVQVRIDETGRVVQAHKLNDTGGILAEFLSTQAVNAAQHWTFQPATINGRNVASDYTITFHFAPAK